MFREHFEKSCNQVPDEDDSVTSYRNQFNYILEGMSVPNASNIKLLRVSSFEMVKLLANEEMRALVHNENQLRKNYFENMDRLVCLPDDDIHFCIALSMFFLLFERAGSIWLDQRQSCTFLKLLEPSQTQINSANQSKAETSGIPSSEQKTPCRGSRLQRRFHSPANAIHNESPGGCATSAPGGCIARARELLETDHLLSLGLASSDQVTTRILALSVLQQLCIEMDDYIREHLLGGSLPEDGTTLQYDSGKKRLRSLSPEQGNAHLHASVSVQSRSPLGYHSTPDKTLRQLKTAKGSLAPSRMLLPEETANLETSLSLSSVVTPGPNFLSDSSCNIFDPSRVCLKSAVLEKEALHNLSLFIIYGARDIQRLDSVWKAHQASEPLSTGTLRRLSSVMAQLVPVLQVLEACMYRSPESQRQLSLTDQRQGRNLVKALLALVLTVNGWISPELSSARSHKHTSSAPTEENTKALHTKFQFGQQTWGVNFSAKLRNQVFDSLLSCLRVMVNLTHRNMEAATTLGMVGGLQVLMGCFLAHGIDEIGNYPDSTSELLRHMFDGQLLVLNILTNCCEINAENRERIARMNVSHGHTPPQKVAPISFPEFLSRYLKKKMKQFKAILKAQSTTQCAGAKPTEDDTMTNREADDLVLSAYIALLLCCLMRDHEGNAKLIASCLKDCSPDILVRCLKAFLVLQKQAGILTREVALPVFELIEEMKERSQDIVLAQVKTELFVKSPEKKHPAVEDNPILDFIKPITNGIQSGCLTHGKEFSAAGYEKERKDFDLIQSQEEESAPFFFNSLVPCEESHPVEQFEPTQPSPQPSIGSTQESLPTSNQAELALQSESESSRWDCRFDGSNSESSQELATNDGLLSDSDESDGNIFSELSSGGQNLVHSNGLIVFKQNENAQAGPVSTITRCASDDWKNAHRFKSIAAAEKDSTKTIKTKAAEIFFTGNKDEPDGKMDGANLKSKLNSTGTRENQGQKYTSEMKKPLFSKLAQNVSEKPAKRQRTQPLSMFDFDDDDDDYGTCSRGQKKTTGSNFNKQKGKSCGKQSSYLTEGKIHKPDGSKILLPNNERQTLTQQTATAQNNDSIRNKGTSFHLESNICLLQKPGSSVPINASSKSKQENLNMNKEKKTFVAVPSKNSLPESIDELSARKTDLNVPKGKTLYQNHSGTTRCNTASCFDFEDKCKENENFAVMPAKKRLPESSSEWCSKKKTEASTLKGKTLQQKVSAKTQPKASSFFDFDDN